ncbi:MAG: cytidine deaminase [Bacilli bacterium]
MTFEELYDIAKSILNTRELSKNTIVGQVGCALETIDGHIFTGVNIDTACSMGFCAEANAIGSMITAGETRIVRLVAVNRP